MRKCLILVLLLILPAIARGGSAESRIMGIAGDARAGMVKLFRLQDGSWTECAATELSADGRFGFVIYPPAEGFYGLSTGRYAERMVYLNPGQCVTVSISDTGLKFTGKVSPENALLAEWLDLFPQISFRYPNMTFEEYAAAIDSNFARAREFRNSIRSGNAAFDRLMSLKVDYDMYSNALTAASLLDSERIVQLGGVYNQIAPGKVYNTDEVMQLPQQVPQLTAYISYWKTRGRKEEYTLGDELAMIAAPAIKGEYLLYRIDQGYRPRSKKELAIFLEEYGGYIATDSQRARLDAYRDRLPDHSPGDPGFAFSFPDRNGQMVSLEDFRGKVVVVDVWATWCSPCRAEIPHLKRVEEEFHGEDVVFVGISVDKMQNRDKWISFIDDNEMGGVQLLAGPRDEFSAFYQITGIPRFMVFDKEGKLVSVDAPRPSNHKSFTDIIRTELGKTF